MLSMHQFVRLLQQGLRYGICLEWLRETRHPHGSRVREAARVTGLAASGLQALTLLQRSKKKKERCKRRTALPCWISPS